MKFEYGEFDGQPFPTPDSLFPEPRIMQFILQYGEDALDAMEKLDSESDQQYIQDMIDAGLLEEVEDEDGNGKLRLTPRMLKGIQHKALLEIFENLQRGTREGHQTESAGRSSERTEGTKAYEFGDAISELDVGATLRNTLRRTTAEREQSGQRNAPALPMHINPNDFEIHLTEGVSDCATALLIDQSGSMMRWGRFYQAKRVALGLSA